MSGKDSATLPPCVASQTLGNVMRQLIDKIYIIMSCERDAKLRVKQGPAHDAKLPTICQTDGAHNMCKILQKSCSHAIDPQQQPHGNLQETTLTPHN